MTKKLCDKLLNGKEQNPDVAGKALKTFVSKFEVTNQEAARVVIDILTFNLIKGIVGCGMTTEIKCECLDLLCDVLHQYGSLLAEFHGTLFIALLNQLDFSQASVGKRVVSCTASLASSLSDDLLAKATAWVVTLLKLKSTVLEIKRRDIQMIGSLSIGAGYHFGPNLGDIVPLLMSYCMSTAEIDEELCEYSLQALESFLLRCPRDISSYCDQILYLTLELISYDPNFTDDMEEDTMTRVLRSIR